MNDDSLEEYDAPTLELSHEEALAMGLILEDTEKTKLVKFKGEIVEIDARRRVSKNGEKIVWITHLNPAFKRSRASGGYKKGNENSVASKKAKRTIKSILKDFMAQKPTSKEYNKLGDDIKAALEQQLGGELSRADIAAFQVLTRAMSGDLMAFKELADRVEGKAVQQTVNANVSVSYTDFLKEKAGLSDEEDESDIVDI